MVNMYIPLLKIHLFRGLYTVAEIQLENGLSAFNTPVFFANIPENLSYINMVVKFRYANSLK